MTDIPVWLKAIVAIAGVAGFVLGILNYIRSKVNTDRSLDNMHKGRQIEWSMKLQDHYYGKEFVIVRESAWGVEQLWNSNKLSHVPIRSYFLGTFNADDEHAPPDNRAPNQLFPLQNLALLLNFWHRICMLHRQRLIDTELIAPLRHEYHAWKPFVTQIADECKEHGKKDGEDKRRIPGWAMCIDELDAIFW